MQVAIHVTPLAYRPVADRGNRREPELFREILPARHNYWPAVLISCLIHLVLAVLLPVLGEYLPASDRDTWALRYSAQPLEIRVPEKLYLASGAGEQSKNAVPAPARQAAAPQTRPATHPSGVKRPPRTFELPDLPIQARGNQTLLQPQYAPQLAPREIVRLPEIMFWASEAASLPRPKAKALVLPGRAAPVAERPKLDAPPRLEMPNAAAEMGEMTVNGAALDRAPALPRPQSTTMPIRTFEPPRPGPPQRGATLDAMEGDPTNVLALAPNAPPLSEILHVPAGNLRAPLLIVAGGAKSDGGLKFTSVASAEKGFGARGVSAAGGSGTAVVNLGPTPVTPAVPGAVSALVTQLPAGLALRVVHPISGVFDLVVQSSTSEVMPQSAGILTGRPIYTVYLKIGAAKDWILQYCIPNSADVEISKDVLRLGNPPTVKAPFPRITFRPMAELHAPDGYLMVHGMIDEDGKFKDLKTAGRVDPTIGSLLISFLQNWEFRPATKDDKPSAVEVLLAIPPGS